MEKLEKAYALMKKDHTLNTKKRNIVRRNDEKLTKLFRCCYFPCKKEYASVLALNLHVKKKHNGGTKKQRDELAVKLILCRKEFWRLVQEDWKSQKGKYSFR